MLEAANEEILEKTFAPQYPAVLRKILWNRGFRENEEVEAFLHPSLSQVPNPVGSLKDLDLATDILLEVQKNKERVIIFGDYDVDGTTSTTLLVSVLRDFDFDVDYFIPHRVDDGYGVTLEAAKKLLNKEKNIHLVITCDCGIGSFEGIEFLKSNGVKVIVTDHHEVPQKRVSADAILNPKQTECNYPDKKLAGVGVAFLLLIGLRRALGRKDYQLSPFLDLVAVGTVCDVADLRGANRSLVKKGLIYLAQTKNKGLRALLKHLDLENKAIKAKDLGFLIGPRINAVGRIGNPELGVRTLLAQTEEEADEFVQKLETYNTERKSIQAKQLRSASKVAAVSFEKNPSLAAFVVSEEGFHLGVVGLLASRIAEEYKRPACVLTKLEDEHALVDFDEAQSIWKGSLRAPVGYHLSNALESIREEYPSLLKSGGGHALAAGVAIEEQDLEKFKDVFVQAIENQGHHEQVLSVDADFEESDGMELLLPYLEPMGNGNPAPLFRVKDFEVSDIRIMKEVHLKLKGRVGRGPLRSVLQFRSPWVNMFSSLLKRKLKVDFYGELTENEWRGNKSIEFILKDLLEVRDNGRPINIRSSSNEASNRQG